MNGRQILIVTLMILMTALVGFLIFLGFSSFARPATAITVKSHAESVANVQTISPSSDTALIEQSDEKPALDDVIDFERADRHAINAPPSAENHLKNLAEYLGSVSSNDAMKARAIFKWITANIDYDVASLAPGQRRIVDPKEVLEGGKCVCGGYSSLFNELAKKAGIQTEEIFGYLKGADYIPGESMEENINHSWNAIYVNGKWYLIDCTLGGGYLDANSRFVEKFEDFYFMTPPRRFILSHYPDKQKWQLLSNPISRDEFIELPRISPFYFEHGLELRDPNRGVYNINRPLEIKMECPEGISLISSLMPVHGNVNRNYSFTQIRDEIAETHVDPPADGDFVLHIFAKELEEDYHTPANISQADSFSSIIQLRINARDHSSEFDGGFPEKFGAFSEREVYLFTPKSSYLPANKTVEFKIRVPGAARVAVVQGEKWEFLDYYSGISFGKIQIERRGTVDIMAQFPGREMFDGLLRYEIKRGAI